MQVDDLELELITDHSEAPTVVHGTYRDCWEPIRTQVCTPFNLFLITIIIESSKTKLSTITDIHMYAVNIIHIA